MAEAPAPRRNATRADPAPMGAARARRHGRICWPRSSWRAPSCSRDRPASTSSCASSSREAAARSRSTMPRARCSTPCASGASHGTDPTPRSSADDVALTWNPSALLSRGIVVRGLGAQRLALETNASTGDVPMPQNLALPIEVRIDHLGVGQLDWRVGTSRGAIHGLAFAYDGGAAGHRVSDVTFVAAMGTITGKATIGAAAPFAVAGRLDAKGDAALAGADADVALGGTLAALTLDGGGKAGAARFTGHASLAPLAAAPLREAALDASGIDLAAFECDAALDRADGRRARPSGGRRDCRHDRGDQCRARQHRCRPAAAAHAGRPLRVARRCALARFDRRRPGRRRHARRAGADSARRRRRRRIVDPRRPRRGLAAALRAARRDAAVGKARRGSRSPAAEDPRRRRGSHHHRRGRARIRRRRGRTAPSTSSGSAPVPGRGELAGRGRIALAGERAFELDATALRFDPASYGAFPAGALDGRIVATGTLAPAWRVHADVALAPGSRLAGVALAGKARGTFARSSIRDAAVDLSVGRSRLTATGNAGEADDHIAVALDAPDLAELAPLFPAAMAQLALRRAPRQGDARGSAAAGRHRSRRPAAKRLKLPGGIAVGTLDVRARVAPGNTADVRGDLAATNDADRRRGNAVRHAGRRRSARCARASPGRWRSTP